MKTEIVRSALVRYSASQMFDLVNDIEAYPEYMEGCSGAEVLSRDGDTLVARLDLKKGGLTTSFTTRNTLDAPSSMTMTLESGPFKSLSGKWQFVALTDSACKVSLDLVFEVNSLALSVASSSMFASVANSLVDGLCRRATDIYQ